MARTKGTARVSGRRVGYVERFSPAPKYSERWSPNGVGTRLTPTLPGRWDRLDPDCPYTIILPSFEALHRTKVNHCGEMEKVAFARSRVGESIEPTGHCYLLNLPTELIAQTLRELVPTGQIFHFTNVCKKGVNVISIHRIMLDEFPAPGGCDDIQIMLPKLSSLCSRLTDITYSIFYGDNQFVFDIAAQPMTSYVRRKDMDTFGSWIKIIPTTAGALAPLSGRAVLHLRDLTLCISISSRTASTYEWDLLEERMRQLARAYSGIDHELKHLVVDIQFAQHKRDRDISDVFEVDSSRGLRMNVRVDHTNNLKAHRTRTQRRLAKVVEPLVHLKGLHQIQVSGGLALGDVVGS